MEEKFVMFYFENHRQQFWNGAYFVSNKQNAARFNSESDAWNSIKHAYPQQREGHTQPYPSVNVLPESKS